MKTINFQNTPEHQQVIINAVSSQEVSFDSVQIMRHISENDANQVTFDHHDIGFFLEEMTDKGIIRRSKDAGYFTKYEKALS